MALFPLFGPRILVGYTELSPRALCHFLKSRDVLRRPCWLLSLSDLTPRQIQGLKRAAESKEYTDTTANALVFQPEAERWVRSALERRKGFAGWCRLCEAGRACAAWDADALQRACFAWHTPEDLARERLGLPSNASAQDVERAFRARIQTTHYDHGGSNEGMKQLIEDRLQLLSSIGAPPG